MKAGKFRKNVAALITHKEKFLGCHRVDIDTWQCVQGGIEAEDKNIVAALQRELFEELGLTSESYQIKQQSKFWRRYYFPPQFDFRFGKDCLGQEQKWFWVELSDPQAIDLEKSQHEFDKVQWIELPDLYTRMSSFKKAVFKDFCYELGLFPNLA